MSLRVDVEAIIDDTDFSRITFNIKTVDGGPLEAQDIIDAISEYLILTGADFRRRRDENLHS